MKLLFSGFLTLKTLLIIQWITRSSYIIIFTTNFGQVSVYWNFFTSILILALDVFFTLRFYSDLNIHKMTQKLFIILGGPILFVILLYGCIMDFISYDDIICNRGCVSSIQPLSNLLSDLHKIFLFFVSSVIFKVFLEITKEKTQELSEPFITWTVASKEDLENNDICVICREKTGNNELVVKNKACQHLFHECCINNWVTIKKECPICRQSFQNEPRPT